MDTNEINGRICKYQAPKSEKLKLKSKRNTVEEEELEIELWKSESEEENGNIIKHTYLSLLTVIGMNCHKHSCDSYILAHIVYPMLHTLSKNFYMYLL
jgi:hypothetical protein